MDMRELTIYGRIGRDAEVKYYNGDKQLISFSVGTTCGFGERQKTIWYKCTSFRGSDVKLVQYLLKGQPVIIAGEHGKDEWTDNNGVQKVADTINIKNIILLPSGEKNQGQQNDSNNTTQGHGATQQQYSQDYHTQGQQTQPRQGNQPQSPSSGGWGAPPQQSSGGWGNPSDDTIPF